MIRLIVLSILITSSCGPKCIKYEPKLVHHEAWTEIMYIPIDEDTDIPIPIYHPAKDVWEPVCVQYEVEK